MNDTAANLSLNRIVWLEHMRSCLNSFAKKNVADITLEPHYDMIATFLASKHTTDILIKKFHELEFQPFSDQYDPSYKAPSIPNSKAVYADSVKHKIIDEEAKLHLKTFFQEVQPEIENKLGYCVQLVNVRFFEIAYDKNFEHPFHTDNFPVGIYKVLAYLNGASEANGSTEIHKKDGTKNILKLEPGSVCLFDSNNMTHRVVPPRDPEKTRISVEFTVAPSFFSQSEIKQPGLIATYPNVPPGSENLSKAFESKLSAAKSQVSIPSNSLPGLLLQTYNFRKSQLHQEPIGLNVGGGPFYLFPGWENIDGAFGVGNQQPFKFSATCTFPYEDSSFKLVYSSHVYEHLSDDVVFRITSEIRRIIRADGFCLIKFPIFDDILEKFRLNNFEQYRTVTKDVEQYWSEKNIRVNDINRCSFAFVNYWNEEYGKDHYEETSLKRENGAYFGPTTAFNNKEDELAYLFKHGTPHEIALRLRRSVVETEKDYIWGHQNAWSVSEFTDLMKNHNFKVVETDKNKIYTLCKNWPKVQKHYDISHWFLLQPC